jgi:DNA invertase Pin-like site-specific DNA recombinase
VQKNPTKKNSNTESNTVKNTAIGYIRVSTDEQAENLSLDMQRESIKAYVKEHKLELLKIVTEVESASKRQSEDPSFDFDISKALKIRPNLREILAEAKRKDRRFDNIIVYRLDRVARNTNLFLTIKAYLGDAVSLHYSGKGESIELENKEYTNLLEVILATFAELEANTIGVRVKAGCKECLAKGYRPGGRIPYGFDPKVVIPKKSEFKKDKNTLMANGKMSRVNEIYNLYINYRYGYRKIADTLRKNYNEDYWNKGLVESIIKNEIYTGYLVWDRRGGRRNPGKHDNYIKRALEEDEGFIEKDTWLAAREVNISKSMLSDPSYYSSSYLLKGKLICKKCNQPMVTRNNGGTAVYRCKKLMGKKSELIIKRNILDALFIKQLPELFNITSYKKLWGLYVSNYLNYIDAYNNNIAHKKDELENVNARLKDLSNLMSKSLNYSIMEKVKEIHVENGLEKNNIENELKSLYKCVNKPMLDENAFKAKLTNVLPDFNSINVAQKRVFIDMILDKVFVDVIDGKVDLDIQFKITQFI